MLVEISRKTRRRGIVQQYRNLVYPATSYISVIDNAGDIKEDSGRKADEMVRQLVCVGLRDGLAPDP